MEKIRRVIEEAFPQYDNLEGVYNGKVNPGKINQIIDYINSGVGTISSVGLTMPSGFSVTPPLTSSGTIVVSTTLNGFIKGNGSGFASSAIAIADVTNLQSIITTIQGDISNLNSTISAIQSDITNLQSSVNNKVTKGGDAGSGFPVSIGTTDGQDLRIITNGSNRATFFANGNVRIGNSNGIEYDATLQRLQIGATGGTGRVFATSDATIKTAFYSSGNNADSYGFRSDQDLISFYCLNLVVGGVAMLVQDGSNERFSIGRLGEVKVNSFAGGGTKMAVFDNNGLLGVDTMPLNNPMTTLGDIVYGGALGVPTRLGVGTNGQVLTVSGGLPSWQNPASGFTNPMTTKGDIIQGDTGGTAVRLAGVATGNVLISGGVAEFNSWGKVGLTSHVSGVLPAANGGTGISSYNVGDILSASSSSALSAISGVAVGNALLSAGVGTLPQWGKINLTSHVTGVLPVANGGSGVSSFITGSVVYMGASTLTEDNASFYFNSTIKGLGLGTNNPLARLEINTPASYGKPGIRIITEDYLAMYINSGGGGIHINNTAIGSYVLNASSYGKGIVLDSDDISAELQSKVLVTRFKQSNIISNSTNHTDAVVEVIRNIANTSTGRAYGALVDIIDLAVPNSDSDPGVPSPAAMMRFKKGDAITYVHQSSAQLSGASFGTVYTFPTTTNKTYTVFGFMEAKRNTVLSTAGSNGDHASYIFQGGIKNVAGTVTHTVTVVEMNEDQAGWGAQAAVSSTNLLFQGQGAANNVVDWHVFLFILESVN